MRRAVEAVIFRGDDVRRADAVPIEGGIEDRFQEIAVGLVIGPLALALETGGDGVVALRFLAKAQFGQARDCRPSGRAR